MSLRDVLGRPEYTGDRRCWPCTVVNVGFVLLAAFVVGRRNRPLGVLVAAVGWALVWVRGYVVPYTPEFAPQLVAALPLPDEWFHTSPARGAVEPGEPSGLGAEEEFEGEELLGALVEVGALTVDGDAVDLDEEFATAWNDEMARLAELDTDSLSKAVFEVAHAAEVSVYEDESGSVTDPREWIVLADGSGEFDAETWLSRPVAIAETAAMHALQDRLPEAPVRRAAVGSLRMFLSHCPDCGAELVETTNASCCGSRIHPMEAPDQVLACMDCGVRLYTFEDRE